jgi:hypothetical protein
MDRGGHAPCMQPSGSATTQPDPLHPWMLPPQQFHPLRLQHVCMLLAAAYTNAVHTCTNKRMYAPLYCCLTTRSMPELPCQLLP